jgi:hypothetical protein
VESTPAAQVLLRPAERRFLEPFVGRQLTAGQAARELGLPVEQMAYRVHAFTARGLLRVSGTVPRKGRPMTLYEGPQELRAPLALLPYEDVRGFFALVDAGLRDVFLSNLARLADRSGLRDWLVRVYRAQDDTVRVDLAPSGGAWDPAVMLEDRVPAVVLNWVPLALDARQAKDLQRELLTLIGRYQGGTGAPSHLLGLFLTPAHL